MKKRIKIFIMMLGIPFMFFPLGIVWLLTGRFSPGWYMDKLIDLEESQSKK